MRNSFLEKLLSRLDRVGREELQHQLQRLAGEKGFLEMIFNTLLEGVLVVDPKGHVMYLNTAVQTLLGLNPDRSLGSDVRTLLPDLGWPAMLRQRSVISRDMEVTYPEHRYLSFYLLPIEGQRRALLGYAAIFHDNTAAFQRTQETIESEKLNALSLLAAGVAHELGNPLNSLHIHFQLLERDLKKLDDPRGPKLLESVRVARGEISRLDTIIRQFLSAIRPGVPELQPHDINQLLRQSVEFLEPELRDKDILVETAYYEPMPTIPVDSVQLKQAFYNLIKNAMQAMNPGGLLRIVTVRTDTHVVISFADTGAGISGDKIAHIFDPYFTTKRSGSGLGLFIVRRIIREHGGELTYESQIGRGTTAHVILPLAEKRVRMLTAGEVAEAKEVKAEVAKQEDVKRTPPPLP
ncbi:PAS domain-containing sensor histidine kinase [Verrucomicrobia bacterium LW23]|nr:PAS domain-containing sensor histidine kinase [Verrucomicrobia bacterium LW23]